MGACTYICFCAGWYKGNVKIQYLLHEVVCEKLCDRAVTGINPITSEFSVLFFLNKYREEGEQIKSYIRDVVAYGHNLSNDILIIIKFLRAPIYCHYKYLCENIHNSNRICETPFFMEAMPELLNATMFKFYWNTVPEIYTI